LNFENGPLTLGTNSTERVRITAGGNVGIGTNTPTALLHTDGTGTGGGNVVFVGSYKSSNPGNPPVSGAGTRMMWYPDKAAFRAGRVDNTQWNNNNIGNHSSAWGYNTTAAAPYSTAWGNSSSAIENYATAWGLNTISSGAASSAWGGYTEASGSVATAWGFGTTAPSYAETVMGRYNTLYTPTGVSIWNANDRLFVIGNGTSESNRANALTVLKNGRIGISLHNPNSQLHINAPSGVTGLRVDINGTSRLVVASNGGLSVGGTFNAPPTNGLRVEEESILQQKVNIGTTANADAALHVRHGNISNEGIRIQNLGANNRHWTIHTNNGAGTLILYSSIGGSTPVGNFNGSTGAYSATSNRHLKTDVTSLGQDVIEKLMQLEPLRYRYLRDSDKQFTFGFMAEDIMPLFPELVEIIGEEQENLALNYAGFSVVAISAIQEQQKTIENLMDIIEKQNQRIEVLEKKQN
jgi:hypothetical protein